MAKTYIQVKMEENDYSKLRRAKGAIEALTGKKITSLSSAVGALADFWLSLYLKVTVSKEAYNLPGFSKLVDSPFVKKFMEDWEKNL
jgi:hypothetical protein